MSRVFSLWFLTYENFLYSISLSFVAFWLDDAHWVIEKSCPVLRVIDQIVNPKQWWLFSVDNLIFQRQHRA